MREWSGSAFRAHQFPAPTWLVTDLLPGTGWTIIVAPAKTGKTMWTLQLAYALAAGERFLYWDVPSEMRVAIVEGDAPIEELQGQVDGVVKHGGYGSLVEDRVQVIETEPLANVPAARAVFDALARFKPNFIIFDALDSLTEGDINHTADTKSAIGRFKMLAQGVPFMVIHHPRKRSQGSEVEDDIRDAIAGSRFLSSNSSAAYQLNSQGELRFIKRRGAAGTAYFDRREISKDCALWVTSTAGVALDGAEKANKAPRPKAGGPAPPAPTGAAYSHLFTT